METLDAIRKRHSIRKYTDEPISEEVLGRILEAGKLAPAGKGLRPITLCPVTDKETLAALSEAKAAGAGMIKDAAAAIVVFSDENITDTWIEDASVALSFMHLMATDQGLGSVWVQMRLRKDADGGDAEANVRRIMDAPDNLRVIGVLPLGHPAE